MALSLRELLEKQRAEREARDQKPAAPLPATSAPVAVPSALSRPEPPQAPSLPPAEQKGRGLLSRFGGSNVTQGQTPSVAPPSGAEGISNTGQKAQTGANGTAGLRTTDAGQGGSNSGSSGGTNTPTGMAPAVSPVLSEDETENLRKNLAFLAANLDEKEVIGQVLRTTVRQIQQHPELNAIMIDSDFDLIVAAARRSMKYTARRKEEKSDAKAKKAGQKAELDQWLKDQGIDL